MGNGMSAVPMPYYARVVSEGKRAWHRSSPGQKLVLKREKRHHAFT